MKFTCPQCTTRYAIGDDKLPAARVLRFACKKCGTVIRLRRQGDRTEIETPDAPPALAFAATGTPTRVASSVEIAKLRHASAPDPSSGQTRVASVNEIRKLRARSEEEQSTRVASIAEIKRLAAGTENREEWHVLVGGRQQGPFDREAVTGMLERKEIDRRTYLWRAGMADWQRLGFVDAFKALAEKAGDAPWRRPPTAKVADLPPAPAALSSHGLPPQVERTAEPEPTLGEFVQTEEALPAALPPEFSAATEEPMRAGLLASTRSEEASRNYFAPTDTHDASYFDKPPGESTRVFMATAGLFRRRRTHRIAAVIAVLVCAALVAVVSLDVLGYVELPGMARVYEMTGVVDPNADRAMRRVESRLQDRQLTAEERARLESLRHRLLGNLKASKESANAAKASRPAVSTEGVTDTKSLTDAQREMTARIFADERKQESKVSLATADDIQAPNLPSGLTVEAIFKVISDNSRSMNLCLGEAMRKGEKLSGKMEIEMTILPEGSVGEVNVSPARMAGSTMGHCTARRIKGWRFPRFNGEPVPVSYPYLLQMGF